MSVCIIKEKVLVVTDGFLLYHGEVIAISSDGQYALVESVTPGWFRNALERFWHKTDDMHVVTGDLSRPVSG